MEQEKIRKERKDKAAMPTFARVMIVLAVLQILFGMSLHIGDSVETLMLVFVGTAALVLSIVTAFAWDTMPAFRKIVRGILIVVPLAVLGLGVFSAIYAHSYNPASDMGYNLLMYGTLAGMFTQLIVVFMQPVFVCAASFGARIDRVVLCVSAVLNALLLAFFMFYSSPQLRIPEFAEIVEDFPLVRIGYVAFAVVYAVLTFVPAIGNDVDHRLPELKK